MQRILDEIGADYRIMFGKLWIWLALGALAAGALVALGQQGQPVSAQASSIGSVLPAWPAQPVPNAIPHPEPEPDRIEKPPAPLPAALNPIRPGPQRYPEDAAALLFLVQSAISGQQALGSRRGTGAGQMRHRCGS